MAPVHLRWWLALLLVLSGASLGAAHGLAQATHRVHRGQTLTRIARRYGLTVRELRLANGLGPHARLREGQMLTVPGHEDEGRSSHHGHARAHAWGRSRHPGVARIVSNPAHRTQSVRLVDRAGRVSPATQRRLQQLLRWRGGDTKQVHPRLIRMMALVSDHFGGRPLEIVSGYRPPGHGPTTHSRHHLGHAIDFRVHGVGNAELRDFCRTFAHVGVGYYPNSAFVHLDVRRHEAHWTDWSGPGEHPRYGRHDPRASESQEAGEPDDEPADESDENPVQRETPRPSDDEAEPPTGHAPAASPSAAGASAVTASR